MTIHPEQMPSLKKTLLLQDQPQLNPMLNPPLPRNPNLPRPKHLRENQNHQPPLKRTTLPLEPRTQERTLLLNWVLLGMKRSMDLEMLVRRE